MSSKNLKELKDKILFQVNELEDETALQMLQEAVVAYSSPSSNKDILEELTDEQTKRLYESIQQANEGKTLTHEEVKQKAKEWLSR